MYLIRSGIYSCKDGMKVHRADLHPPSDTCPCLLTSVDLQKPVTLGKGKPYLLEVFFCISLIHHYSINIMNHVHEVFFLHVFFSVFSHRPR